MLMPITLCVQCAMRAMVENRAYVMLDDETPDEHMAKHHPDPVETYRERQILEAALRRRWAEKN